MTKPTDCGSFLEALCPFKHKDYRSYPPTYSHPLGPGTLRRIHGGPGAPSPDCASSFPLDLATKACGGFGVPAGLVPISIGAQAIDPLTGEHGPVIGAQMDPSIRVVVPVVQVLEALPRGVRDPAVVRMREGFILYFHSFSDCILRAF